MFAWQSTVQDEFGNAVLLPVVTVYLEDGLTLADIYDEAGDPLPNPLTGTLEGFVQFWAKSGRYKIVGAIGGDVTPEWSVFLGFPEQVEITTRDGMVDAVAGGFIPVDSVTYWLDGSGYLGTTGATDIPDLPGLTFTSQTFAEIYSPKIWNPVLPVTPDMFGPVSTDAERRAALLAAFTSGSSIIALPDGDFRVGDTVQVPKTVNNVALILGADTRLIRASNQSILSFAGELADRSGSRGVVIEGGTVDGNFGEFFDPGNMFNIHGATDIRIEGVRFINTPGLHAIDLNNCQMVRIRDCRFEGTSRALATMFADAGYYPEAVQISHERNPLGTTYSTDDTIIDGCYFGAGDGDPWPSGVGDHKGTNDVWPTGTRITNNTFDNCENTGASFMTFNDLWFSKNTVIGGKVGVRLRSARGDTSYAVNGDGSASGVNRTCKNVNITDNVFRGQSENSVDVAGSAWSTATGYKFHNNVTISNNIIDLSGITENAINVEWTDGLTVCYNTTTGGNRGFFGHFIRNFDINNNDFLNTSGTSIYIKEVGFADFAGTKLTSYGDINGNFIKNSAISGINVSVVSDGINSKNNKFQNISTDTDGARYCVAYDTAASNAQITGNICYSGDAVNKNSNIVDVTQTCSDIIVSCNSGYFKNIPVSVRAIGVSNVTQTGSGSPEGLIYAPPGSQWMRTDGGLGTAHYVKESAASLKTGWVGK